MFESICSYKRRALLRRAIASRWSPRSTSIWEPQWCVLCCINTSTLQDQSWKDGRGVRWVPREVQRLLDNAETCLRDTAQARTAIYLTLLIPVSCECSCRCAALEFKCAHRQKRARSWYCTRTTQLRSASRSLWYAERRIATSAGCNMPHAHPQAIII